MTSLRSRLIAGTIAGSLAVLSVAGVGLYTTMRRVLQADFNETLAAKARTLANLAERDGNKIEFELDYRTVREFEPGEKCEYLELTQSDGQVLFRSRSLGDTALSGKPGDEGAAHFTPLQLPDGRPGRLVSLTFRPRESGEDEHPGARAEAGGPLLTLALARDTRLLDRTLTRLAALLIAVGAGTMLACAAVMNWVVRRATRPLDALARQISAIGENLSARVNLPDAPAELAPVATRLNETLERLQRAFEREKALSADVAHELRTPLAGLRSRLEVSLSRQRDAAAYRADLQECLLIVGQTQQMVEKLLSLVRIELGRCQVEHQDVDLQSLLMECWEPLRQRATERELRISWQTQTPVRVRSDRLQLRHVVHNLLDNAVSHADFGGQVSIETLSNSRYCRVRIRNSAAGMETADAEHVFERFWRGEAARSETGLHCGLGLALARKIVTLLGGTILVSCANSGVFEISFDLPALFLPGEAAS